MITSTKTLTPDSVTLGARASTAESGEGTDGFVCEWCRLRERGSGERKDATQREGRLERKRGLG